MVDNADNDDDDNIEHLANKWQNYPGKSNQQSTAVAVHQRYDYSDLYDYVYIALYVVFTSNGLKMFERATCSKTFASERQTSIAYIT